MDGACVLTYLSYTYIPASGAAGYISGGAQPSEELWMYSTVNATWELLGSQAGEAKPKARMEFAMTAVGNKIVIHGGVDGGGVDGE